ncbi:hypothetical protein KP509_28G040000 [Ceratopteris richardii]|uniref:Plastid lipid-associated protein/fibrillin conserved domain-containing protein n=1 Tax=Ceratopteris richardii TaxID=49495 RepID=A0A8T2RB89_CERRI|nr:hypothetical protein KP509_28G040000 [Ceratopteris richardii]
MAATTASIKFSLQHRDLDRLYAEKKKNSQLLSTSFCSSFLVSQPAFGVTVLRKNCSPVMASIFPFSRKKDIQIAKEELLEAIAPLDRGADASPDDQGRVDMIAQQLENLCPIKDTVASPLVNGKWELLYTTSSSILKKERPKLLRPGGPIYQAINNDTLRAQNLETWPFFNQVTANLTPLSGKRVAVKFDVFKIAGLISIKAPERARGELEITFVDEELRISRGSEGNLFVLRMVDPSYRVPT